jgi:hypothetical protein
MGGEELEHDIIHVAVVVVGAGQGRQCGDTGRASTRAGAKELGRVVLGVGWHRWPGGLGPK